MVGKVVFVWV